MIITIKRIRKKTETIDGKLYIEGMRICDCAENAKSAIKAGTYPVVITKCQFHGRKMPCILLPDQNQPPCKLCSKTGCIGINSTPHKGGDGGGLLICPQIKAGNGVYHREDGTIIVGEYIAPGCLKHPKEAFNTIYDRLRKSAERGHEITLVIEEHYPKPHNRELTNYELGTRILNQL